MRGSDGLRNTCGIHAPGLLPCRRCTRAAAATRDELDAFFEAKSRMVRVRKVHPQTDAMRARHQAVMPIRGERDHARTYPLPRHTRRSA